MFALVDAVSFYASAEKVFDPSIRKKPVVVLTNNDGCICAVCPIARRLGIPKFKPYFQVKWLLEKHNVVVRSSNYELYADVSDKMMNVIARYCDNQYIYSIDESFLQFNHYQGLIKNWHHYGHQIRTAVWKETRLPVGVGFGSTPTLAKAANHAAKKLSGFNGVAVIDNDLICKKILLRMAVTDVWGIGSRLGKKLNALGVQSAWDLAQLNAKQAGKQFSVVLARTINELNGVPCLSWDEVKTAKKEIFSTRSFGQRIQEFNTLKSALTSHCAIVGRKARQQSSLIKKLLIFAASSPHDNAYYKRSLVYEFPIATDNTFVLAGAVQSVLPSIFQAGISYYRCGVGALELTSMQYQQGELFIPVDNTNSNPALMHCYDRINRKYGHGTLQLAGETQQRKWQMRRAFLSPSYTSNWQDIPLIKC